MNPEEEGAARSLGIEPFQGLVRHHIATALHQVEVGFVQPAEIKVIEIGFKALVQAEA